MLLTVAELLQAARDGHAALHTPLPAWIFLGLTVSGPACALVVMGTALTQSYRETTNRLTTAPPAWAELSRALCWSLLMGSALTALGFALALLASLLAVIVPDVIAWTGQRARQGWNAWTLAIGAGLGVLGAFHALAMHTRRRAIAALYTPGIGLSPRARATLTAITESTQAYLSAEDRVVLRRCWDAITTAPPHRRGV